jgi:hypothetical protein
MAIPYEFSPEVIEILRVLHEENLKKLLEVK